MEEAPSISPVDFQPQQTFIQKLKQRKFLLAGILLSLFIFISVISVIAYSQNKNVTTIDNSPKTWKIVFNYVTKSATFELETLTLLNEKIIPDYRTSKNSEYKIELLDKTGTRLYFSPVPVTTMQIYSINEFSKEIPNPLGQPTFQNILYVHYVSGGTELVLTKEGQAVLQIEIPQEKNKTINPVQKTSADTCRPLQIVFISDNYTDFNAFHSDVEKFKQALISTAPYSTLPGMFDFQYVDNTTPLGCERNGLSACFGNHSIVDQIVRNKFPNYSKAITLVNGPEQNQKDGGILGIASGIGGDFGIFPNNYGNITLITLKVAKHEILGHMVGELFDRYVLKGSAHPYNYDSNCSNNPAGNAFWKAANPNVNPTLGCYGENLYAPEPPTCSHSNSQLASGGSPNTMMSAASCGANTFDAVELAWITDQVLPAFAGCANTTPTPTATLTTTPATSLTPTVTASTTTAPTAYPQDPTNTPANTNKTYTCRPDPSCQTNNSIQVCKLICE